MVKLTSISENLDYKRIPVTKNVRNQGKYPYYGASGIVDYVDDYIFDEDLLLISEDGANLLARSTPIAFSVSGKIWVNNHAHVLRFENLITQKYVEYFIAGFNISPYVTGMAQPKLNQKALEKIEIPLPPLEEQHRIVSILDVSFEKIDALKKNAEENLKNAKALFQQVLAQELKPKEGWVEKKLGEVCNNISYGTSLPSSENGIYKYLRMNNITLDGTLDLNNLKYITVPDKELAKCMVEKGDLLFNRTNSHELVGKSCVFENDEKMVIAGYIIRIRLNKEIAPKFANYYINLQRRLGYLKPLIVGAVHQANISAKSIQTINFVYPTLEEQHRIVAILDTLSEKCRRLEEVAQQTIRECDALKQSILRQAFSGEL